MDATPDNRSQTGLEIEYASLREESLKRIESRQQIISITLTIAGAFLGIGWGSGGPVALMIYPALAALLAAGWAQNEVRLRQLSAYIRDHLESAIPGLGWERYSHARERETLFGGWPVDVLSVGGIFVLTQVLAIGLSLFRFTGASLVEWVLLAVDIFAILLVLWMVEGVRRRSRG
jgi:hypothetical protein